MTALVTGGNKGIGHAIVEELAEFGAAVHTCSRNQKEIDQCLQKWQSKGLKVTGSVCDVSIRAQREKLIETVSSISDRKLNILVNNAATYAFKEALKDTAEDISTIMSTNFGSAYHLSQLSHPLLKASQNGSILNISSIASIIAVPRCAVHAASDYFCKKGLNYRGNHLIRYQLQFVSVKCQNSPIHNSKMSVAELVKFR